MSVKRRQCNPATRRAPHAHRQQGARLCRRLSAVHRESTRGDVAARVRHRPARAPHRGQTRCGGKGILRVESRDTPAAGVRKACRVGSQDRAQRTRHRRADPCTGRHRVRRSARAGRHRPTDRGPPRDDSICHSRHRRGDRRARAAFDWTLSGSPAGGQP